jgi:hypothetical protein
VLTLDDLSRFRQHGYVKGRTQLPADLLDDLRQEAGRITSDPGATGGIARSTLGTPGSGLTFKVSGVWKASPAFWRLATLPPLVSEIAQLYAAPVIRLWRDQLLVKPPHGGGPTLWHQDAHYWPSITPHDQITAWIALDDATAESGSLRMVRGSHLWGHQPAFLAAHKGPNQMPGAFEDRAIQVELCVAAAGEVHFHHALTWHCAGGNVSTATRRAYAVHYMSGETREADVRTEVAIDGYSMTAFRSADFDSFPVVWRHGTSEGA